MTENKFDYKKLLEWLKKQYLAYKRIISGFLYMILVFVVIYGISAGVYDGFPILVPYIIMLIFLFMAFMRLYQCIMKAQSKGDSDKSNTEKNK